VDGDRAVCVVLLRHRRRRVFLVLRS
jgi:hypothetical protein